MPVDLTRYGTVKIVASIEGPPVNLEKTTARTPALHPLPPAARAPTS
jgi:hypothetical protein